MDEPLIKYLHNSWTETINDKNTKVFDITNFQKETTKKGKQNRTISQKLDSEIFSTWYNLGKDMHEKNAIKAEKRKTKVTTRLAEETKNYVGYQNIEYILEYINSEV